MSEPLTRLAELASIEPDAARAERIRVSCRTRLERRARRVSASYAHGGGTARIWRTLIVVLGVGYMTEVIMQALRIYGLR